MPIGESESRSGLTGRRSFLKTSSALSVGALTVAAPMARSQARAAGPTRAAPAPKGISAGSASSNTVVPDFASRVLSRMGFGPARRTAGTIDGPSPTTIFSSSFELGEQPFEVPTLLGADDIAYFESLGDTDDERLAAYVDQQLQPDRIADGLVESRMAAHPASFRHLEAPQNEIFPELRCAGFNNYIRPLLQVEGATFLRATYSRRQLFELVTDFWHNHLNVYAGGNGDISVSWASWDRDVIRGHAFGNFYEMLYASAQHPVMLRYLDNYENSAGGFNENYAREIFELHTLGAEHYLGPVGYSNVTYLDENPYLVLDDPELNAIGYDNPNLPIASAYIDDDVIEAARALTGWRYDNTISSTECGSGEFYLNSQDHDVGRKGILTGFASMFPADGEPLPEGRMVIKLAAYHPGTAVHIARKLCRRLISDNPPESIVQAAAATFFEARLAPDQIAQTLRTILLSDEFKDPANWGEKFKRPFEYVVSAMRSAGCDYDWRQDDRTSSEFFRTFEDTGQKLFWWRTPNGYPDSRDYWQGSNSMVQCWRTVDWLADKEATEPDRVMKILDITLEHIDGDPTPRSLVEFWCHWILGFTPEGGWTHAEGSDIDASRTSLGQGALEFITQQSFGTGADSTSVDADESIPRAQLSQEGGQYAWHRRLRGLVKLILWSPQFMQR